MAGHDDPIDFGNVQSGQFPPAMRAAPMWLAWKTDWAENDDGEEKARKVPRAPWNNPGWPDKFAPNKDPASWTDFETASEWVEKLPWSDHGLAYYLRDASDSEVTDEYDVTSEDLPDAPRVGLIDFDDVIHTPTGDVHPQAREWVARFGTFTEVSPSGTGLHALGAFTLPEGYTAVEVDLDPEAWDHGPAHIEVYDGKRYTTMTGERVVDLPAEIRETQEAVGALIEEFDVAPSSTGGPDALTGAGESRDPESYTPRYDREELSVMDKTGDMDAVWDAIFQLRPSDFRLDSTLTEGEMSGNGRKSFDPSWESSASGTRLGYEDGVFIYRKGNVGLTAAHVVALEERIIRHPGDTLSGEKFEDAVDALRDRGAQVPVYDPEMGSFEVSLHADLLQDMDDEERRRFARKRSVEWPDVETVRDRVSGLIRTTMAGEETAALRCPTSSGKSHTTATTEWLAHPEWTGDQPVIQAAKTREARDQNYAESEKAGVDAKRLRGRGELCPLASGACDPGDDGADAAITMGDRPVSEYVEYRCDTLGHAYSGVHREIEEEHDGVVPCEEGDTQCPSKTRFEDIPRTDDGDPAYDVIHCTNQFFHVPSMRMHTNVVYDEKPDFSLDVPPEIVRRSVTAYVEDAPVPFDSYRELTIAAETGNVLDAQASLDGNKAGRQDMNQASVMAPAIREASADVLLGVLEWGTVIRAVHGDGVNPRSYDEQEVMDAVEEVDDETLFGAVDTADYMEAVLSVTPTREWYERNWNVHAAAPAFTRAVWDADPAAGGFLSAEVEFEPPRLDANANEDSGWNREQVRVVFQDDYTPIYVVSRPDLSLARSVIGLDATAVADDPVWRLHGTDDIRIKRALSEEEETLYRRYTRGLHTVQVGENLNPVTGQTYLDGNLGRRINAVVDRLADQYGDKFSTAITSKAARSHVRSAMESSGVSEPELMHYGSEESRNDFAGESVGYVAGAIDPGDEAILVTCAALDLDARAVTHECPVCEGAGEVPTDTGRGMKPCPTCEGDGIVREKGRTFEGRDADTAEKVLASVREHHIAQSAGRWARDAGDDDDTATVFIHTNAAPEGFIDAKVPGAIWTANENQRRVIEAVRDASSARTVSEVAEAVDAPRRTVQRTLKQARDMGVLDVHYRAGTNGAHLYAGESDGSVAGAADLGPARQEPIQDHNTVSCHVEAYIDRAVNASESAGVIDGTQMGFGAWRGATDPPS